MDLQGREEAPKETPKENVGSVEARLMKLEGTVSNLRTMLVILIIAFAIGCYLVYPIVNAWDKIEAIAGSLDKLHSVLGN
ncbi:MAG TPA: hypothetical protein VK806_12405 [Bacteroidia bacterium]|jgi:hypothetical protein|nr:hypothetical protein [Bacteroidia bacterium]